MTWEDAKQAFIEKTPVTYVNKIICRQNGIDCPEIAEITLYRGQDGIVKKIVGALDKNRNCIYRDTPENFRRT